MIVFSGKRGKALFRRLAGRNAEVDCDRGDPDNGSLTGLVIGEGDAFQAPKRGRNLHIGSGRRSADWCEVLVIRKPRTELDIGELRPIVAVALTSRGSVFLDERLRAANLLGFVTFAGIESDHCPATAELVAGYHGALIGLASPTDSVPPGEYGIYSDGAQHIEAVSVTPAGRRLYLDLNGDAVSSNVLPQINSLNFG